MAILPDYFYLTFKNLEPTLSQTREFRLSGNIPHKGKGFFAIKNPEKPILIANYLKK